VVAAAEALKPGGGFIGAAPEPRWALLDRWIRRAGGSVGFPASVLWIRVLAVTSGPNGPDRSTALVLDGLGRKFYWTELG
jgi:hypothetical protein